MSTWADFCISAVQYDAEHKHIVKAQVRTDNGKELSSPVQKLRSTIVEEISNGKTYVTVIENSDGNWVRGQPVKIVAINGKRYIKTIENSKEADNLENLPEF